MAGMLHDPFILVLGLATLLTGIVALVLAVRRSRRLRASRAVTPRRAPLASVPRVVGRPPPPQRAARPLLVDAEGRGPRLGLRPGSPGVDLERVEHAVDSDRVLVGMDLEAFAGALVEPDAGGGTDGLEKICPACGSRYGAQHRICTRDESELATIN